MAAFLAKNLLSPEDVDDILQDVASAALERGESSDVLSPKSYLFIIARNLMSKHLKAQATSMAREIDGLDLAAVPSEGVSVEQQVESDIMFNAFLRSVQTLPRQCRRVFLLRKLYGWSHKKIATHLNISRSTVERHITNAITRLDSRRNSYFESPVEPIGKQFK